MKYKYYIYDGSDATEWERTHYYRVNKDGTASGIEMGSHKIVIENINPVFINYNGWREIKEKELVLL